MSGKGIVEWTSPMQRLSRWLQRHSPCNSLERKMESGSRQGGRKRHVFKGSVLVSILLELYPRHFHSRSAAVGWARQLLHHGHIRSIFGSTTFEDSAQLYMWQDDDAFQRHRATMTSSGADVTSPRERGHPRNVEKVRREDSDKALYEQLDPEVIERVKSKVLNRTEAYNIVTSYNNFFQELHEDTVSRQKNGHKSSLQTPAVQTHLQQHFPQQRSRPEHRSHISPSQNTKHQAPPQIVHHHHSPLGQASHRSPLRHSHHPSPSQNTQHPSPPQNTRRPSPPQNTRHPSPPQNTRRPSPPQNTRRPSPSQNIRHPSPPQNSRHPSPPQDSRHPSPPQKTRRPSPSQNTRHSSPPQNAHHSCTSQSTRHPSPSQSTRQPSTLKNTRHPSPSRHIHHPSQSQNTHQPSSSQSACHHQHLPQHAHHHHHSSSEHSTQEKHKPKPRRRDDQYRSSARGHQAPVPSVSETPRSHHQQNRRTRKDRRGPAGIQASAQPSSRAVPSDTVPYPSIGDTKPSSQALPSEPCPLSNRGDLQCESTCSTDSSLDTQTYFRTRDRNSNKHHHQHHVTLSADNVSRAAARAVVRSLGGQTRSQVDSESRARAASIQHNFWSGQLSVTRNMSSSTGNTPGQQARVEGAKGTADPLRQGMANTDRAPPQTTTSDYELTSAGTLSSSHPQPTMLTSSGDNVAAVSDPGAVGRVTVAENTSDRVGPHWDLGSDPLLDTNRQTGDYPYSDIDRQTGAYPYSDHDRQTGIYPYSESDRQTGVYPYSDSDRQTGVYPYSDNEKQLMEEMKRMKREHQDILRTYEGRINKLMAKMHELRSIAEMLENSSTKPSSYGLLPAKATLLQIMAAGSAGEDTEKKTPPTAESDVPPPLPPRPGRGGRVYPNKPIVRTNTGMRTLLWSRIILGESGEEDGQSTVWHGMQDVPVDTEDLERLYSIPVDSSSDDVTLLDDINAVRGRPKHQLIAIFDGERSQRILSEMRNLRCSLSDVTNAVNSLDCGHLHQDSFAELLELLNSPRDVDKILHHVKRKGPGQLDTAEFLVFELSKLDHFRERLEFLRFKNKLQINLFEIDQQLRELNTACDELLNNVALKKVLQTILSVGNYLNGGTERGQADGFTLDILNRLKDFVDRSRRGNLLELVMRTYCLHFEADLNLGCPTRFRLPEPSNMRHAAQVSFEEIQKALRDLREELSQVRERLEVLSKRESSNLTIALRVSSENFLTSAVEVLAEERRVLEDTKARFWKTTAYFHSKRQNSPQEFFQIFATFLHDCKYYWKLAHRNLARDQFEKDFSTKCQLSCSSLPGFRQLKDSMMRTVVTLQHDQDMRASKAQQLQHINNWIESLGKCDTDLRSHAQGAGKETTYGNDPASTVTPRQRGAKHSRQREEEDKAGVQQKSQGRSASPKPITSTPPNVHKPQPITHVSPTPGSSTYSTTSVSHNVNGSGTLVPTTSNVVAGIAPHTSPCAPYQQSVPSDSDTQDGAYEPLTRVDEGLVPAEDLHREAEDSSGKRQIQDSGQRKNTPFSLKSWLKRDQRQRSGHDDLPTSNSQSLAQQQPSSAKSPTTPFNKLRHTVVHKLAGSSSSKKSPETTSTKTTGPSVPPKPARSAADSEPVPSHLILFHSGQQQAQDTFGSRGAPERNHFETKDYQNFYYQLQELKDRMYPGHSSAPSTLSSVTSREFSPHKYEALTRADGSKHTDRTCEPRQYGSQEYYSNPNMEAGQGVPPASSSESPQKEGGGRNRAPIALNLGSNMSISDAYGHPEEDPRPGQSEEDTALKHPINLGPAESGRDAHVHAQPSIVDSKRVRAQPVPVYKAKLIPNYENQTKLEPRLEHGIRGQAEPVQPPPVAHLPQSSDSSEVYKQELQRKSEMYINNYPAQSPISPTSNPASHVSHRGAFHMSPVAPVSSRQVTSGAERQTVSPEGSHSHGVSQTPPRHGDSSQQNLTPKVIIPNSSANSEPILDGRHRDSRNQGPSNIDFPHYDPSRSNPANFGPVTGNSRHYDDFQTPARRSASAQNILDRGSDGPDGPKASHSSEPGASSYSYLASISNMTTTSGRKDDVINAVNMGMVKREEERQADRSEGEAVQSPTSETGRVPAKVSTLISRWEKKVGADEVLGGPLVDGEDNPPSMTSTPISRRKHAPGGTTGGQGDSGDRRTGARTAPHMPQSHPPPHSHPDTPVSRGRSSGDRPFPTDRRGHRSQSQPRERPHRDHHPHSRTFHHSPQHGEDGRHPRHTHTPRTPAPSSRPHHQQPQHHSNQPSAHPHPSTNTYPPRSSNTSRAPSEQRFSDDRRLPSDLCAPTDLGAPDDPRPHSDVRSIQRKVDRPKQFGRNEEGRTEESRPVPLPRHHLPSTTSMAVVKPTVVHQGQLTYMDI